MIILFNWEIDDALLSQQQADFDPVAVERSLDAILAEEEGSSISSIWTSGSGQARFDVYASGPDGDQTIRIDGEGQILRIRGDETQLADGGWIDVLILLHHNLLSGDTGSWIVGISGILLISNIVMGIVVARPWLVGWFKAMKPHSPASARARYYAWHRAIGLWAAVPALITVSAGVLLVFYDSVEGALGAEPRTSAVEQRDGPRTVGFAQAVASALSEFDGSSLTSVSMPGDDSKEYTIRLRQDDELREIYGTTTVVVSAIDGRLLDSFDANNAGATRTFLDSLFPIHTGEAGGLFGRIIMLFLGTWLMAVSVLGAMLWWTRTRRKKG